MRLFQPVVLFILLITVAITSAQAPPTPPAATVAPAAPTEALEVLALKRQLTQALKQVADLQAAIGACQGQLGTYHLRQNTDALVADEKAIVEKFEKANPGFTLNVQLGAVTPKAPDPVKK